MFGESASLILKHSDISTDVTLASVSNTVGQWSNGKQSTTWRLNLRKVVGDVIFEKYSTFILRLNQVAFMSANFPGTANTDNQLLVQLSGLNFVNSTYQQATKANTNKYNMLLLNLPTSTVVCNNYSPNVSLCTFSKTSANVELTIDLIRLLDGTAAQYGAVDKFPHGAYNFDIIGCDLENK